MLSLSRPVVVQLERWACLLRYGGSRRGASARRFIACDAPANDNRFWLHERDTEQRLRASIAELGAFGVSMFG